MNTLLQITRTIPSGYFYYKLNKELENIQNRKIALNSTALFHASATVILGLNYFYTNDYSYLIQMNTGGYVLFDLYYLIKERKYDLLRIMYLYHHIVLYPYLLLSNKTHYWPQTVFFAELSNIPNYIVYYSLKNDAKKKLWKGYKSNWTKKLLKLQLYTYGFLRVFVLGYYTYLELSKPKIHRTISAVSMLYPFSLVWFLAMLKQNC
jgi:hypothetical protein